VLLHVPRLWTLPPRWKGSGTATCFVALDPTLLLGRAPTLSCVPRIRIPPPCSEGLQHCYVFRGSEPRLHAQEGSDAVTYPAALDPTSPLGRAPMVSHVPRLSIWDMGIKNKKCLTDIGTQIGSRVSKARSCVINVLARCSGDVIIACKTCRQSDTVQHGAADRS
jgi:hypothetical protein